MRLNQLLRGFSIRNNTEHDRLVMASSPPLSEFLVQLLR